MKKFYHILVSAIFTFLLFFAISMILFQTKWVNDKISFFIKNTIEKKELPIKIGSIEGKFLHSYEIKDLQITISNKKIFVKTLNIKIALLDLLFKKISFDHLFLNDVFIEDIPQKEVIGQQSEKKEFLLPYNISISSFLFQNVHIYQKNFTFKGKAYFQKDLQSIMLDCTTYEKSLKNTYLYANINGKREQLHGKIKIASKDITIKNISNISFKNSLYFTASLQDLLEKNISLKGKGEFFIPEFEKLYQQKTYDIRYDLDIKKDLFNIKNLHLFNNFLSIQGNISGDFYKINFLDLSLKTENLSLLDKVFKGFLEGNISYKNKNIASDLFIKNFKIKNIPLENFQINLSSDQKDTIFEGKILSSFTVFQKESSFSSDFTSDLKNLSLKNLFLNSSYFTIQANLQIADTIQGNFSSNIQNLFFLKEIHPFLDIQGSLSCSGSFYEKNNLQRIKIHTTLQNIKFLDLSSSNIFLSLDSSLSFQKAVLEATFQKTSYKDLYFEKISFQTNSLEKTSPYIITMRGKTLSLDSGGFWKIEDQILQLNIKTFFGKYLETEFFIEEDFFINYNLKDTDKFLEIKKCQILSINSFLYMDLYLSKGSHSIQLHAKDIPFNFSYKSIPILSKVSFGMEVKDRIGSFFLDLQQANFTIRKTPISLYGDLYGSLKDDLLSAQTDIHNKNKKILHGTSKCFIKYSFFPFSLKIETEKPCSANVLFQGKAEELFDFLSDETQSITGDLSLDFSLQNTFKNPNIQGYALLKNGTFDNYIFGISLKDINSDLSFKNTRILLDLSAKDSQQGEIKAQGTLSTKKGYPFDLDIQINNLLSIQTDLIQAITSGNLKFSGNTQKSHLMGNIDVVQADLAVPEKIPKPMPKLNVTFIKKPKEPIKKAIPYPISLDLMIHAPDKIYVKGRGLSAELKGDVHLKGTFDQLKPFGTFDLLKGSYSYSGRNFTLTKGLISFDEKTRLIPELFVKAETKQRGIIIIATLKGPLDDPKLSFSSSPSLPLNSILSLLIFGQPLSGISSLQAMQIATSSQAISDTDDSDSARSLGIDRLSIISEDVEDPDKVAVQIGKYLTRGVMVTYSQGTEEGTSNASLEIDLGHGFLFQIETIQEEQQNKGTIKWTKDF